MKIFKRIAALLLAALICAALAACGESPEAKNIPTVTIDGTQVRISVTSVDVLLKAGYQVGYTEDGSFVEYDAQQSPLKIAPGKSFEHIELARAGVPFATVTLANYGKNDVEFEQGVVYAFSAEVNNDFRALNIQVNGQTVYGKSPDDLQPLFAGSELSADGLTLTDSIRVDDRYDYTIVFTAPSRDASVDSVEVSRAL